MHHHHTKSVSLIVMYIISIVLMVFDPVLTFGFAYIGGMILKAFVGNSIATGLNLMFNTNRFTPDSIPLVCATLATIVRYFKSSQPNNNNRNMN